MTEEGGLARRQRWPFRSERTLDVALAAAVVVAVGVTLLARLIDRHQPSPLSAALVGALGALMLVRRRWPQLVLAVTLAILSLYYALELPPIGVAVPIAAAVFSAAEQGHLRTAIAGGAGFLALSTIYRIAEGGERLSYVLGYELVAATVLVGGVTALGDALRSRRRLAYDAAERVATARRQREAEARRQVAQERSRIARDVHDVVAHTVSAIAIQADVAAEAIGDDERTAVAAIDNIRRTSRQAVKELRAALDVLHDGSSPDNPRHPVAGLADLPRIIETAARSGLEVVLSVNGDRRPVPLVVDAAAQRIVQESLTNVMRHAEATRAWIELDY